VRRTILMFFVLAAGGRFASAQESASSGTINVPNCFVAVAEQADLPPLEAGVIREVAVHDGDLVAEHQLLVQLDDRKACCEQAVAQAKADAARTKAEAADINIKYAKKAKEVADADFAGNKAANDKVPGSVPAEKMRELDLKRTETALSIDKAIADQKVAAAEARVAEAELEAAKVTVERHKVTSPIAGKVNEIKAHKGEAVQPTQPVVHVVNLDNVWVEGRVPSALFTRGEIDGQDVTVDVLIKGKDKRTFPGKVVFVKPLTDSGGHYMVRASVQNEKLNGLNAWLLNPGMQAEMNIKLRKL
jgi:multidrug efflux pump subunit AcrA (membrane-fusion protein)